MTKIYFVRHAKPDYEIHDDSIRPLTEEGIVGSKKVTEFLLDKGIEKALCSPFMRSIDTIKDFTDRVGLEIEIVEDFRERKVDDIWIDDFDGFAKRQWEDFEYKLDDGENLGEVQNRNIGALKKVLADFKDKNIIIGSHGTALSAIMNYYDKKYDFNWFTRIKELMPFIVCLTFEGITLVEIEEFILE